MSPALLEATNTRGIGGIETVNLNVARGLAKTTPVMVISTFYPRFRGTWELGGGVRISEVPLPSWKSYPPTSRIVAAFGFLASILYSCLAVLKIIKHRKELSILVVTSKITGILPALAARLMRIPVIFSEGNLFPWVWPYVSAVQHRMRRSIARAALLSVARIMLVLSHGTRVQSYSILQGMHLFGYRINCPAVIPAGVDTRSFIPVLTEKGPANNQTFRVGFIGRLSEEKGAPLLLEIVKRAQSAVPQAHFVIIGDGPYRSEFDQEPNVDLEGTIPHRELPSMLNTMSVVISMQREIGLAELEALSCGRVLILRKTPYTAEVIEDMKNGILVEPDAAAYICTLKRIYLDYVSFKPLGDEARVLAVHNFDWERIASKWSGLIYQIGRKSVRNESFREANV